MKEKQLRENDFNKSLPKLKGKWQVQESNYGPTALTRVCLFFCSSCFIQTPLNALFTIQHLLLTHPFPWFSHLFCHPSQLMCVLATLPPTFTLLIAVHSDFVFREQPVLSELRNCRHPSDLQTKRLYQMRPRNLRNEKREEAFS